MLDRTMKKLGRPAPAAITVLALVLGLVAGQVPAQADDGYLGVNLQDLDEALTEALDLGAEAAGVLVTEVVEDSPADAAGLRRGDIITHFGDDAVSTARRLTRLVQRAEAGESVTVRYLRKGEASQATVEIGERPRAERDVPLAPRAEGLPRRMHMLFDEERPQLGVRVEEVGKDLGRYFEADGGLLVLEVYEDSSAEAAGIQVGDILLKVGDEAIEKVEDLREALADYDEGDQAKIELMRDRKRQTLEVEVREPDRMGIGQLLDRQPGAFQFDARDFPRWHGRVDRAPRVMRLEAGDEDLQEQLDLLRDQLEELTSQVEKLKER